MKKLFAILLVLVVAAGLFACNLENQSNATTTADTSDAASESNSASVSDREFFESVSASLSGSVSASLSQGAGSSQSSESTSSTSDSEPQGTPSSSASSSEPQGTPSSSASSSEPGAEPEPVLPPTALVENGTFLYQIVYRSAADKVLAEELKSYIETTYGVTVEKVASDFSYKSNGDKPQILIGSTRYAESEEATKTTRYQEWTVHVDGPKIVVFAHSEANLKSALQSLKNQIAAKANGTGTSCSIGMIEGAQSSNGSYVYNSVKFNGVELREYRIIYASGFKEQAEGWQTWVGNSYGYLLPIGQDTLTEDDGSYEILIGKTNRAESQAAFAKYKPLDRAFFFSGKKAVVVVDNTDSVMELRIGFNSPTSVSKLLAANKDATTSDSYLPAETLIEGTMRVTTADTYPRKQETDLRLMSFNVKSQIHSWDTNNYALPVFERAPLLRHMLMVTNPDVIGLQEITGASPTSAASGSWNKEIAGIIGDLGYDIVMLRRTEGSTGNDLCYNPIAYKRDKYTVLKTGFMAFRANNGSATENVIRNCAWVMLQDKVTGNAFIVVNSHWSFVAATTPVEVQNAQAAQEAELINQLAAAYPGVPIFCTADYNSKLGSQAHKNLVEGANLSRFPTNASIDHVYYRNGLGVTEIGQMVVSQNEFHNSNTYYLSDHHAVYADIGLADQAPGTVPDQIPDFVYTTSTASSSSVPSGNEPSGSEPSSSEPSSSASSSEPIDSAIDSGGSSEPQG